jgi:2'-5' RNA ligase
MEPVSRHTKKSLRTFIAVKVHLGEVSLGYLNKIRDQTQNERIRWVNTDNLHITLRFLGDTPAELIGPVSSILGSSVSGFPDFRYRISGLGIFRNIRNPKVIWLGIDENERLHALKNLIDNNLKSILKVDGGNLFSPHLTIGRMKNIENREHFQNLITDWKDVVFADAWAEEVNFYESILKSTGPEYLILSSFRLSHGT